MTTEVDEYAVIAHQLVDDAINNAFQQLIDSDFCDVSLEGHAIEQDKLRRTPEHRPVEYDSSGGDFSNITWPTIEEFTADLGIAKLHEFIEVNGSFWWNS